MAFEFSAYDYEEMKWGTFSVVGLDAGDVIMAVNSSGKEASIRKVAKDGSGYPRPWTCGEESDAELIVRRAVDRGDVLVVVRGGVLGGRLKKRVAYLEEKIDRMESPRGFRAWSSSGSPFEMVDISDLKEATIVVCSRGKCLKVSDGGWVSQDGTRWSEDEMLALFRADAGARDYARVIDYL